MTDKKSTGIIHHPYTPPPGFAAAQPGVYKASTVQYRNVAAMRARDWRNKTGYTYGLHGTPTTFILEERIAALEHGKYCVLVPSGLASIAVVGMALLSSGDEVLIPSNAYGPNKALCEGEFARWGIAYQVYDAMDAADLERRIGPKTKLAWLEAPGSVSMEFPPVDEQARICRQRGVTSALDNTWAGGIALDGFALGCDIVAHALTKYPSGGGDVLMGVVVTNDEALNEKIKLTHMHMGFGVGVNDVEAILRSLPSLAIRYEAQDRTGREIAAWLKSRPEIAQVLHPAMEGAPGHEHWKRLCGGKAAGLFSVVFDGKYATSQVDRFCDALKLFKLGYSWGGPVSLVVPYDMAQIRLSQHWGRAGVLVRFSMGLENAADLRADLEQALEEMKK
jgi:cystathionine beta-lyase